MVYSLHGKDMVLSKIVFRSSNRHGTDKSEVAGFLTQTLQFFLWSQ